MAVNLFSNPFQSQMPHGGGYGGYGMPFGDYGMPFGGYGMPFGGYGGYGMPFGGYGGYGMPFGGYGGYGMPQEQFDFASYFNNLMSQYFGKQAPMEQAPMEQAPMEQAPMEQAPMEQAPTTPQPYQFGQKFGLSALQGKGFSSGGVQQLKDAGIASNKKQANQLYSDFSAANAGKDVTQQQFMDYAQQWKPQAQTFTMPAAKAASSVVANNPANIKTAAKAAPAQATRKK